MYASVFHQWKKNLPNVFNEEELVLRKIVQNSIDTFYNFKVLKTDREKP